MTSKIVAFILGIVIGAGVCAAVLFSKSRKETTAAVEATKASFTAKIADLEAVLMSAKAKSEQAQQIQDDLTARIQEWEKKEQASDAQPTAEKSAKRSWFAELFGGGGTNGMSDEVSDMIESHMEQRIEGQILALKAQLNLTPEQETAIRHVMTQQMSRTADLTRKMMKGDMSPEEAGTVGKEFMNEDAQIRALLTPEQLTAYDEYEKKEKVRMARLQANSELLEMQSTLHLTEEQQDKVFAVLVEQDQADSDLDDITQTEDLTRFETNYLHQLSQKKAEALRGVLTAEQFELYQKYEEQQLKMIKAFMPQNTSNGTVHVMPVIAH